MSRTGSRDSGQPIREVVLSRVEPDLISVLKKRGRVDSPLSHPFEQIMCDVKLYRTTKLEGCFGMFLIK